MDINQRVTKFRQKCINKLSRRDAEFFFDNGTIKDLSVFCSLVKLKSICFKDDFELEMMIVRYLQILMILSSVSDDPRDEQLVEKFMTAPFECEEIVKMRPPYKNAENIEDTFQMIKKRYPLPAYWNLGGFDTSLILAATPKKHTALVNRILEYFSTPIVGIGAVLKLKPHDFHFLEELKDLVTFEMNRQQLSEDNRDAMNWIIKFKLKKTA